MFGIRKEIHSVNSGFNNCGRSYNHVCLLFTYIKILIILNAYCRLTYPIVLSHYVLKINYEPEEDLRHVETCRSI